VTAMLQKSVYESAHVRTGRVGVVVERRRPGTGDQRDGGRGRAALGGASSGAVREVPPAVAAMPGKTTTEQTGPISTTTVIGDIHVADSVVAATNTATATLPNMPALQPTPQARAIGVRLNCIVEVEVVFFGDRRPSDPGTGNPDTSATDIARAMMDRVSDLS